MIILGEKTDQSQLFNKKGERIPVTFIKTTPCYLIDVKTPEKQNYFALKLAYGTVKNIKKPVQGELNKAGIKTPLRFLKEFRLENFTDKIRQLDEDNKRGLSFGEIKLFVGEELKPTAIFKIGDKVNISGTTKGKGFQGVVKRHGFAGGPKTHGQSDRHRAPGSIGGTTTPGRVYKGKRMAGRMGGIRNTVKNLEIMEVKDSGILVGGVIPGSKGSIVEVRTK